MAQIAVLRVAVLRGHDGGVPAREWDAATGKEIAVPCRRTAITPNCSTTLHRARET